MLIIYIFNANQHLIWYDIKSVLDQKDQEFNLCYYPYFELNLKFQHKIRWTYAMSIQAFQINWYLVINYTNVVC